MKPTGVKDAETYAGLVYYEEDGVEDLVTFTAAKKLSALLEYVDKKHSRAKLGQYVYFCFKPKTSHLELNLKSPQDEPFTGWTIKPHIKPCKLRRCDVDNFGEANYPLPPCCLVSVYGSPGAVPSLHYSVPLDGVADPVTLFIHRSLRTAPPSTVQDTSSSSSTASISQTRRETEEGTFRSDIAHRVMTECTGMIKERLDLNTCSLVDRLLEKRIINEKQKNHITDQSCGLTANQRMDELLSLVKTSIREDGEDFGLFLEIIKQENTKTTDRLAKTLLDNYKSLL
ncbi:PREDICTED: uncharacterized protein LOC109588588 [Amphimedon queenslandica]|nr:PREDICTED: uncharacterized protein LOC109588588 [Amphimedon queenslandica]|eukprot:XP_019860290.1 PREDICTED: uncharacterized protein LOC109588588 [Amphimedon queenslandica]